MLLIFMLVFMACIHESFGYHEEISSLLNSYEQISACHQKICPNEFGCECRRHPNARASKCVDRSWICGGFPDCDDESDEVNCLCSWSEFACRTCGLRGQTCNNQNIIPFYFCLPNRWREGEMQCQMFLDQILSKCLNETSECDGVINCDCDEKNCSECPLSLPLRCDCNQRGNYTCDTITQRGNLACYHPEYKCDGIIHCADSSDELGCKCGKHQITCECLNKRECTLSEGCKNITEEINGYIHCPLERVPVGRFGRIEVHRLNSISDCNGIGFPQCDNSTCYNSNFSMCSNNKCFASHVLCTSYCDQTKNCDRAFQCANNHLILLSQFCDGIVDCIDGSDEIVNLPGFKCDQCILPENNLHDDFPHCSDKADLYCSDANDSCFRCLDKRFQVFPEKVCDGMYDCYDMSDECLCDSFFNSADCVSLFQTKNFQCFEEESRNSIDTNSDIIYPSIAQQTSKNNLIRCQTKFLPTRARLCDGRPECKDSSDECQQCNNPPSFCYDNCHRFFLMHDRYCDGVEDPAWKDINNSAYPTGFHEMFRPKRFKCSANDGKVSIGEVEVCDGKVDCLDFSDEENCPIASVFSSNLGLFSSDTEMIANPLIRGAFWIIGFVVLVGNIYVIITTIAFLRNKKKLENSGFQYFVILNISMADFIMGIYLLTIAAYTEVYSGQYGAEDHQWRTSLTCSIIGSLAVLSSETSCFLMVVLTAFRLVNIVNPIKSLTSSLMPWKLSVIIAWLLSIVLSIVPFLRITSNYFVYEVLFPSQFNEKNVWDVDTFKNFVCRHTFLSNKTISNNNRFDLTLIQSYVERSIPNGESLRLFGYYGKTSVCLPRFFVDKGDSAWECTVSIITVNFICFLFIAIGYVFILKFSTKSSAKLRVNKSTKQTDKMQKLIARIIVTDFCCWIPICIMTYVRLGVVFSDVAYEISAVLLLPINSALNPFLFSSLPDKLINLCCHKRPCCKN